MPSYWQRHWREIGYWEQQERERREREQRMLSSFVNPPPVRLPEPKPYEPVKIDPLKPIDLGHWCKCEQRWVFGPRKHRHRNGLGFIHL